MSEAELIELLKKKDENAVEILMRVYGPLIRYIIAPILADERDREECLSDVALRVWEKFDSFDGEKAGFKTWLTAVTRNAALNRARGLKESQELTPDLADPDGDPEGKILARERQLALKRALKGLTAKEQALFYRKYYYRQPTAQIAAEMGMTQRAVEGRLYRIRGKLRNALGGAWND